MQKFKFLVPLCLSASILLSGCAPQEQGADVSKSQGEGFGSSQSAPDAKPEQLSEQSSDGKGIFKAQLDLSQNKPEGFTGGNIYLFYDSLTTEENGFLMLTQAGGYIGSMELASGEYNVVSIDLAGPENAEYAFQVKSPKFVIDEGTISAVSFSFAPDGEQEATEL